MKKLLSMLLLSIALQSNADPTPLYDSHGQIIGYDSISVFGNGELLRVRFTDGTLNDALAPWGPLIEAVTVVEGEWSSPLFTLMQSYGQNWLVHNLDWHWTGIKGCGYWCAIIALNQSTMINGKVAAAWIPALDKTSHPYAAPPGLTKWSASTVGKSSVIAVWSQQ